MRKKSRIYRKLGFIAKSEGNINEAEELFDQSFELMSEISLLPFM